MSEVVLKGLVLHTAVYRESSKMLTVLTDRLGKISVSARGATRGNSRIAAACQPLAFSEMTLSESKGRYYLREAATSEIFYGLTADLKNYALGYYFLELADAVCPEELPEPEILSLTLNALWLLSEDKLDRRQIKSVYELRLLSLLGYAPGLDSCGSCGTEVSEHPVFDLRGGVLLCRDCAEGAEKAVRIDAAILQAMRHIVSADRKKVFSFRISEQDLRSLDRLTESYVREQLERGFSTLDYYKQF